MSFTESVGLGENCLVLEDNTIQPFASIGRNVTLWSGNHIGHHAQIRDHCFIASHVVTDSLSSRLLRLPLRLGMDAAVPDAIAREIESL
jgi:NDP-sugar pyrophosphorylase family protein